MRNRFLISAILALSICFAQADPPINQDFIPANVDANGNLLPLQRNGHNLILPPNVWLNGATLASQIGGTVTSASVVTANGVSATVATPTTTPAFTFTLGNITPTTIDGLTISTTTGTFTLANAKTFTVNNTLALSGIDASTLNIGSGGTLGTAAYTASSAYEVPLTFSTGLTRLSNTVTVNTSQNIATFSNFSANGFLKTGSGNGTLSIDTTAYVPQATTVNGHALTGNVIVTPGDLSLVIGTNTEAWSADLDALAALSGTNTIYYRSGAHTWTAVTIGSGLSFSTGTLSSTAGGGNVTGTGLTSGDIITGAGGGAIQDGGIALTVLESNYQAFTVSAAGNTNSNISSQLHTFKATANAGSGTYTATIAIPTAGRAAGDHDAFHLTFAASVNPTVEIHNNTSGGTLLFTWTGDGTATEIAGDCVFDGTNWGLRDAHFVQ
jgi:hypothetical protein